MQDLTEVKVESATRPSRRRQLIVSPQAKQTPPQDTAYVLLRKPQPNAPLGAKCR
jgi:hypothetical protein